MNWRRLDETRKEIGDKRFALTMVNFINEGKLPEAEFSIRGLWEACGQPNLEREAAMPHGRVLSDNPLFEADGTVSTAFPTITGALINKMVQAGYDLEGGIGDQLVRSIPSTVKDDTIVGFTAQDGVKEVGEGMEYEETSLGEKYHKIYNRKFGRIIALTAEMVKFDQTGQVMARASSVGEKARAKWEEIHMDAILAKTNSGLLASWRPAGTATTLYSATSTDPWSGQTFDNIDTNTLADETDVDELQTLFSFARDEKGDYISVNPKIILTSPARAATARKIMGSTSDTRATYSAGVINPFVGAYQALASPWVTATHSAAYWLLGDFQKQFVRTLVYPLQTFQMRSGSEMEFNRDIVAAWKSRFMIGVGAIDNKFVCRSTGAS